MVLVEQALGPTVAVEVKYKKRESKTLLPDMVLVAQVVGK